MRLKFRIAPRRFIFVDVRDEQCPLRACFWLGQHTVRSAVGASGCGSQTTDWWECGRRDQTGCPRSMGAQRDEQFEKPPRHRKRAGAWERIEK